MTSSSTSQSKNIGFAFLQVAREFPEFPAIMSENYTLSYGQLWGSVHGLATRLQSHGVNRESIVALNTGEKFVSLTMLLATSLLGCQFIVANPVLARAKIVTPTHFFRSPDASGSSEVDFIEIDREWFAAADQNLPNADGLPGYANENDPWLILNTSGTTGHPKFVVLSQRIAFDRTAAISDDFPKASVTFASLFGCTSRPFFARALGALLNGCAIVDSLDVTFWEVCGVNFVCGSPSQAVKAFEEQAIQRKFKRIEVSGAKLTDVMARQLLQNFETVVDVYGASETNKAYSNLVSLDEAGEIHLVGNPVPTTRVEIVHDDGSECQVGKIGSVRICNDYTVEGYLNAPDLTAKSFRDGYFFPGDRAYRSETGALCVVNREDNVFNLGGNKVDATLVDTVMAHVEGVRDAICFKNPKPQAIDELLAFIELEDGAESARVVSELEVVCLQKLGYLIAPKKYHLIDHVPRGEGGQAMRRECEKLLLAGAGLGK